MNIPKLIMLVGLQGSGKSTIAQDLAKEYEAVIVSSDKMRKSMFGDETVQSNNDKLFNKINADIKEYLSQGKSVIYDATNINSKRRKRFIDDLNKIFYENYVKGQDKPYEKYVIVIATPYKKCVEQNNARDRVVDESVIYNTYKSFNMPAYFEGWDKISIIYHNDTTYINSDEWVDSMVGYNQDNPNHSVTLGLHCMFCRNKIMEFKVSKHSNLYRAALIHDCGKPAVQTYKNYKGNDTKDIAHYYNHNCAGAYDSLFFDKDLTIEDKIERAFYIQYHMIPYEWERQGNKKLMNKYRNLWGEQLYSDILLLHIADLSAH